MKRLLLMAVTALIQLSGASHLSQAARGDATTGRASVIDGDTLEIRGLRFRLHGVDAPESSQTCKNARSAIYRCGALSANRLAAKIGVQNITCVERDRDRYQRIVAVCRLGREDLNAWLVREGLAVAYIKYSRDYADLENQARIAKRGLWAGIFERPADYRARLAAGAAPGQTKPRFSSCTAARAAGAAPLIRGTPDYNPALDRDNDGRACEP